MLFCVSSISVPAEVVWLALETVDKPLSEYILGDVAELHFLAF